MGSTTRLFAPPTKRVLAGNRTAGQRRYQWQGTGQLAAIDSSAAGATRYAYNALGPS